MADVQVEQPITDVERRPHGAQDEHADHAAHDGHTAHAGQAEHAAHSEHDEHPAHDGHDEHDGHDGGHGGGHGPHDGHGGGHEHKKGLAHTFRERAISLSTMERPLRLMTGLALAELIVTAALLAVRGLPIALPSIAVFVQGNHLFQMPLPVFLASLLFLTVAWSYLLAGALHAHPLARVAGLALFTWAMLGIRGVAVTDPYRAIEIGLLAAPWLAGAVTWLLDRRAARTGTGERDHRHRFHALTFGAVFAIVVALYGVAWLSLRGFGALLFPAAVSVQLSSLRFVLIPVLFLAGTDFAEWGEATGERLADLTGRVRPPRLIAAATALIAVAVLAALAVWSTHQLAEQLVPGLLALGLVLWLLMRVRAHRALPERVPYAALTASAVLYFAVLIVPSLAPLLTVDKQAITRRAQAQPAGALTTYRHAASLPHFSMAYPAQWQVVRLSDQGLKQPLLIEFNGISAGNISALYVLEASATGEGTLVRMRQQWSGIAFRHQTVRFASAPAHGPWQVTRYVANPSLPHPIGGYMWERRVGPLDWLVMSQAPTEFYHLYDPTFAAMVNSWSPTVTPAGLSGEGQAGKASPAISDGDRLAANMGLFWLVVAAVTGSALALRVRRLRSGALAASALFVTVAGALLFLSLLPTIRLVYGSALSLLPAGQHLGLSGEQAAVALASLLVVGWLVARRRLTARFGALVALLFGLNVSLQIVAWIVDGYSHASDLSGRLSVAQAIIVLLALLWDVTMSGEEITNVQGAVFPRHTRVLLFFGYVILVATMVLYFSSLQAQATGAAVEAQFETEVWPQSGLLGLGVPLLLVLFVLKVCHWLDEPEGHAGAASPCDADAHGTEERRAEHAPISPATDGLETAAASAAGLSLAPATADPSVQ